MAQPELKYITTSMSFDHHVGVVEYWNQRAGHLDNHAGREDHRWGEKDFRELAVKLIEEEVSELRDACVENYDKIEALDALADILFTVFGLAGKAGLTKYLEDVFHEVCKSNNSKLASEIIYDENGKVQKPEGYFPPRIDKIVRMIDGY